MSNEYKKVIQEFAAPSAKLVEKKIVTLIVETGGWDAIPYR